MKKEMLEENKTSDDLVIYDLDKLDTDTSIDYETISENEDFILNNNKESLSDSSSKKQSSFIDKLLDINWHVILLVVLIFSVVFIIYRITNWGTVVDLNNLGTIDETDYDVEVLDNILENIYNGDNPAATDGVTNIVLLGNDTFAQNRGTNDDMAKLIADLSGANVYNCAFTGSYLASTNYSINPDSDIMDAFNLYWLTTAFAIDNLQPYEDLFAQYGDQISPEAKETFETLCSIDFNTVDVIGIMYDANDYLAAKPLVNMESSTDVCSFTGNLEASIELIQDVYPHIRIIVMSPTYAYALNQDGDYVSSDLYCYLEDYKLSTYALMIERSTSVRGVSFVDNIYGTVNENNADQYLLDHINLNVKGRQKLAERFVYALNYYNEKEE